MQFDLIFKNNNMKADSDTSMSDGTITIISSSKSSRSNSPSDQRTSSRYVIPKIKQQYGQEPVAGVRTPASAATFGLGLTKK